ncbi:magnesium transporter [Saccharicrinis carchari]|uniref:Magnesium transport protein CorA n=1 Tax=Saccharicrinis carchari TaxID=1168039 RepID=A0A521B4Q0_SACCC|nr:magnesium/cobalt transporter CorA [Saccharicrinis carchari]SMO42077.1 magnesium transporter [Saccharicrinis carchari]
MARFIKSNKEFIGISPDSIRFRGEKKTDSTLIKLTRYNENSLSENTIGEIEDLTDLYKPGFTSWLNIDGLHDMDLMRQLPVNLDIEPVIISEVLNTHARPKVIEYDNCLYIGLKMLHYLGDGITIKTENIVFVVKEGVLITFQERTGDVFDPVRERLKNAKKRIRRLGADYLAFTLIDIIIDNYTYLISRIGQDIETLDEKLLRSANDDILHQINKFKSELIYLHKSILPGKEMIYHLIKMDSEYINEDSLVHYRELQSNINHAVDSLNNYKEILSSQLNIYHTQVSSRLNDVMKFLTVFSVIFIPLTFIAGIYGTNFVHIPELHYKLGYPVMLVAMAIIAVGMLVYFKRKRWI